MKNRIRQLRVILVCCAVLGMSGQAAAVPFVLVDDNATVTIDPASQDLISNWTVNGVTHLRNQSFWYRVGPAGPEQPLATLIRSVPVLSDINGDGDDDTLFVTFTAPGSFLIEASWTLDGGPLAPPQAGATADLITQITFSNLDGNAKELHIFEYSDVDLFGSFADDTATATPGNPDYNTVSVLDSTGLGEYEAVFTPASDGIEVALFDSTLTHLTDAGPSSLNGQDAAGAGDITWAAAWNFALPVDGSAGLSQDQRIGIEPVPEPGLLLIWALGLVLWVPLRRRAFGDTR